MFENILSVYDIVKLFSIYNFFLQTEVNAKIYVFNQINSTKGGELTLLKIKMESQYAPLSEACAKTLWDKTYDKRKIAATEIEK